MRIEFDIREKKPKLWNVAVLTAVTLIIIALLLFTGAQAHAVLMSGIAGAYFLILAILLFLAFIKQLQYNPYSYNTIYYMGFSLFLLFVFATLAMMTRNMIRHEGKRSTCSDASISILNVC